MRASIIAHKSNIARIIHHSFYPKGSTMVNFPLSRYYSRERHTENRSLLADRVRYLRTNKMIPKGWIRLAD